MAHRNFILLCLLLLIGLACKAASPLPTLTPPSEPIPPSSTVAFTQVLLATVTLTLTLSPDVTLTSSLTIVGQHQVKPGESLFCIGRAYGVLPSAIAQTNGLDASSALSAGQILQIPAVQWTPIPPGVVCPPQFKSPFPGLTISLPTRLPVSTATDISFVLPTATANDIPMPTPLPVATITDTPRPVPTDTLAAPSTDTPWPTFWVVPTATCTPISSATAIPNEC